MKRNETPTKKPASELTTDDLLTKLKQLDDDALGRARGAGIICLSKQQIR